MLVGVFDASKGIHSDKHKLAREQMRKGLRVPCVKYVIDEKQRVLTVLRTRYLIEHPDIDYNSELKTGRQHRH